MKKTTIASRKGGNGGYNQKSKPADAKGPTRKCDLRDYAGKAVKK